MISLPTLPRHAVLAARSSRSCTDHDHVDAHPRSGPSTVPGHRPGGSPLQESRPAAVVGLQSGARSLSRGRVRVGGPSAAQGGLAGAIRRPGWSRCAGSPSRVRDGLGRRQEPRAEACTHVLTPVCACLVQSHLRPTYGSMDRRAARRHSRSYRRIQTILGSQDIYEARSTRS